jgi:hypothetical protein
MTGRDYSAMRKADLLEEVGRLQERLEQAEAAALPAQVDASVPEADALARCVRAIDALPTVLANSYGSFGDRTRQPDQPTIARLLRTLADKYGVPLIETTVEVRDCQRAHLDQIDPMAVITALGNSVPR